MVTADHGGYVKYWQSNMNNVKMFQAHKEAVRALRWELVSDHKMLPFKLISSVHVYIYLLYCTICCDTSINKARLNCSFTKNKHYLTVTRISMLVAMSYSE